MFKNLKDIRCVERKTTISYKIIVIVGFLILGILLGVLSKHLDCTASNELPYIVQLLDIRNFFSRFAIWVLIALDISVYSNSPVEAGMNVFAFFLGMVSSYYWYSNYVAGFFPKSYAVIWFGMTLITPLMAYVCWYAKGTSKVSFSLSAMIIAVLFNMTFVYGWIYFEMYSLLELLVFICGLAVLKRNTIKDSIMMTAMGIVLAFVLNLLVPFYYG